MLLEKSDGTIMADADAIPSSPPRGGVKGESRTVVVESVSEVCTGLTIHHSWTASFLTRLQFPISNGSDPLGVRGYRAGCHREPRTAHNTLISRHNAQFSKCAGTAHPGAVF